MSWWMIVLVVVGVVIAALLALVIYGVYSIINGDDMDEHRGGW